jgi:hypothetical protein
MGWFLRKKGDMVLRKLLVVSVLLLLTMAVAGEGVVVAAAGQRPIEDFVNRQGTFCIYPDFTGGTYADTCPPDSPLIVPPVANFIGWTDLAEGIAASVDYAGLADAFAEGAFGTETTGTVTERPLKDGRAEIHVKLHTKNALSWVVDGFDFTGPLLFGHRAPDVEDGEEPALGESLLHVKFINPEPGAELPDLIQLLYFPEDDQELLFLSFNARADAPPDDGTPGRVQVVQTGLFMTEPQAPTWDGFPVENIILLPVGQ